MAENKNPTYGPVPPGVDPNWDLPNTPFNPLVPYSGGPIGGRHLHGPDKTVGDYMGRHFPEPQVDIANLFRPDMGGVATDWLPDLFQANEPSPGEVPPQAPASPQPEPGPQSPSLPNYLGMVEKYADIYNDSDVIKKGYEEALKELDSLMGQARNMMAEDKPIDVDAQQFQYAPSFWTRLGAALTQQGNMIQAGHAAINNLNAQLAQAAEQQRVQQEGYRQMRLSEMRKQMLAIGKDRAQLAADMQRELAAEADRSRTQGLAEAQTRQGMAATQQAMQQQNDNNYFNRYQQFLESEQGSEFNRGMNFLQSGMGSRMVIDENGNILAEPYKLETAADVRAEADRLRGVVNTWAPLIGPELADSLYKEVEALATGWGDIHKSDVDGALSLLDKLDVPAAARLGLAEVQGEKIPSLQKADALAGLPFTQYLFSSDYDPTEGLTDPDVVGKQIALEARQAQARSLEEGTPEAARKAASALSTKAVANRVRAMAKNNPTKLGSKKMWDDIKFLFAKHGEDPSVLTALGIPQEAAETYLQGYQSKLSWAQAKAMADDMAPPRVTGRPRGGLR